MTTATTAISTSGLSKSFGRTRALDGLGALDHDRDDGVGVEVVDDLIGGEVPVCGGRRRHVNGPPSPGWEAAGVDHLLRLLSEDLAGIEGVRKTETFMYLRLLKEAYTWSVAPEAAADTG